MGYLISQTWLRMGLFGHQDVLCVGTQISLLKRCFTSSKTHWVFISSKKDLRVSFIRTFLSWPASHSSFFDSQMLFTNMWRAGGKKIRTHFHLLQLRQLGMRVLSCCIFMSFDPYHCSPVKYWNGLMIIGFSWAVMVLKCNSYLGL